MFDWVLNMPLMTAPLTLFSKILCSFFMVPFPFYGKYYKLSVTKLAFRVIKLS